LFARPGPQSGDAIMAELYASCGSVCEPAGTADVIVGKAGSDCPAG
jgi:hypothetical protein